MRSSDRPSPRRSSTASHAGHARTIVDFHVAVIRPRISWRSPNGARATESYGSRRSAPRSAYASRNPGRVDDQNGHFRRCAHALETEPRSAPAEPPSSSISREDLGVGADERPHEIGPRDDADLLPVLDDGEALDVELDHSAAVLHSTAALGLDGNWRSGHRLPARCGRRASIAILQPRRRSLARRPPPCRSSRPP